MMRRSQVATSEFQNAADSPTYDDSHMLTASAKHTWMNLSRYFRSSNRNTASGCAMKH
jgi:hypothetical protein